jgi:hypothetical protein
MKWSTVLTWSRFRSFLAWACERVKSSTTLLRRSERHLARLEYLGYVVERLRAVAVVLAAHSQTIEEVAAE